MSLKLPLMKKLKRLRRVTGGYTQRGADVVADAEAEAAAADARSAALMLSLMLKLKLKRLLRCR